MKRKGNNETPFGRHDLRNIGICAAAGIFLMLITLFVGVNYSRYEAQKTMDRNIGDLKKQINSYNDFLASDEAKSLIRLTEQAEDISTTLSMLDRGKRQEYIDGVFDSLRLDCIFVLDGELLPDGSLRPLTRYGTAGGNYGEWSAELHSAAVRAVLGQPKKIYSARITHGDGTYDIAAVARTDAEGIVFCAARQNRDSLELHYSAVRSLMARNETRLSGTLYIAEGEKLLAANRDDAHTLLGEVPEISALKAKSAGSVLTRFVSDGEVYYGGTASCQNYDIFAFYPAHTIFSPCRIMLLFVFCLYVMTIFVLSILHFRARVYHDRELERQYEIIRAISHVYRLTVLLDLENRRYELLKYPKEWGELSATGIADAKLYEKFAKYADERFRTAYREFIDPETLTRRLAGEDYAELEYRDREGNWLIDKLIVKSRDADGGIASVILARKRINERKKAELEYQERLETAIKNEQLANRSKTDFLRRISHDIRTPINVILGMLEIGNRNPTDTALLADCRAKAQTAAEYLLELVNDILTLNRADNDDGTGVTASVFCPAEEVRRLYPIASEQAKQSDGVTLEPPELIGDDLPLVGEALHLRQIMMNVITNALRYGRRGGRVHFSLSEAPARDREGFAEVRFVCEDDGIGMSHEFQERMFEPFAQENGSPDDSRGGFGFGLSIVARLVKSLDGKVEVESEKGIGTRFEITLYYPYAGTPEGAPFAEGPGDGETGETGEGAPLAGLTVLIAEDNELNMEVAEFMVTGAGAGVIRAYDGRQAVEIFAASDVGAIDVVLTDAMMPVMDGAEEARRIRALDRPDAKTVPIIAMTANLFEEDLREYTEAGMTGVLPKPLKAEQLIRMIVKKTEKGEKGNG